MKRHPVQKALVGLATVFAFLVISAAQPAGAAEIESGTLYIGGTPSSPTFTFPLGGDAPEGPCVPEMNEPLEPFSFEYDEEKEFWWADGGFVGVANLLGTWIKAEFDFGDLSGETGAPLTPPDQGWNLDGGGVVTVKLYLITWDEEEKMPPCDKGPLVCEISVEVVLIPDSYHYKGPGAPHLYLNADSVGGLDVGDCDPLLALFLSGQPAYIRDLIISLP